MSNGLGRMIFANPTADMRAIRVEIKRHESRHPTMNPSTGFNPFEHFPLEWAHCKATSATRLNNGARDETARRDLSNREAPYGDCCNRGLNGREPAPET
jgi:hypothetical protein